MAHLSEDELTAYAANPDSAPNRASIEAHLATCATCGSEVEDMRTIAAALSDPATWSMTGEEPTATRLRALRIQVVEEDEAADILLAGLLENPARAAWANLAARRKYRTAGVVRRLVRAAHEACDGRPLDALTLADAAIDVAGHLTDYPRVTLQELRGTAWKERGNALLSLGRYDAALDALDHAEREFRQIAAAPLGPVMVNHARAIVHYERGELARARSLLTECAAAYNRYGEPEHYMRARHCLANILYREQDVHGAQAIYQELLAWGKSENDLAWIGRTHRTLGHCAYQLRDFSAAAMHFHESAQAFRELGLAAEVTRTEWGFGLVLIANTRYEEALRVLAAVRDAFTQQEMLIDAALVTLSMIEAHHARGDVRAIVSLAGDLTQTFMDAGMLTSALTAFAYLKDTARAGKLTAAKITYVCDFVRRLEREPALLFAPKNFD